MTREARRSLATLLRTAWRADRGGVVAIFALNLAAQACWLTSMVGVKVLFDAAVRRDAGQAVVAAFLIVGIGQLTFIFGWRQWSISLRVTERTSHLLDEELMTITAGLPGIEHHERPEYADRIALVRQDRRRIGFAAYVVALNLRIWVQLAGSVVLMVRLHPLLLLLPAFGVASFVTQTRAQRHVDRAVDATAGLTRQRRELFDLLTTAPAGKEARVFGLRNELLGRHLETAKAIDGTMTAATVRSALLQAAGRFAFAAGYLGAVALVLQRALDGHATAGDVALAITLAAVINTQVAAAAEELGYLRRMIGVGTHYVWLRDYAATAGRRPSDLLPVPVPAGAELCVEDVSFRYPGTDPLVLDRVSFRVPPGTTVALVGENGSGKTTLAKLLLGMYEPDEGRITVGGNDLRRFEIDAFRRQTSAAFQDFARYELRASESVGVGDLDRLDDPAAVLAAISRAGAEDVVTALPDGLDTQLGAAWAGVDLSGGQWQKVAVSRALMRDQPLLLLFDEPTAALDPLSEHTLFGRVATAGANSTLIISHRFSTVRMAQWIVVLAGGRVVESGTHDDLVGGGGLYAELFALQQRSYA